jgi:hypothetical protein
MAIVTDLSGNGTTDPETSIPDYTSKSIFDEIQEVERHLHSEGVFFGTAAAATATHFGDADSMTVYQATAGNDTWGTWLQLLGSDDTPFRTGMTKFDAHLLSVIATTISAGEIVRIQIAEGLTGAAALTAGTYTETIYRGNTNVAGEGPIMLQSKRALAGTNVFARIWVSGTNADTMGFFLGLHEYED